MSKEKVKEPSIKEAANLEMESLVEQHNELVSSLQEVQGRLQEVKTAIISKQGYLKALEDCEACD